MSVFSGGRGDSACWVLLLWLCGTFFLEASSPVVLHPKASVVSPWFGVGCDDRRSRTANPLPRQDVGGCSVGGGTRGNLGNFCRVVADSWAHRVLPARCSRSRGSRRRRGAQAQASRRLPGALPLPSRAIIPWASRTLSACQFLSRWGWTRDVQRSVRSLLWAGGIRGSDTHNIGGYIQLGGSRRGN